MANLTGIYDVQTLLASRFANERVAGIGFSDIQAILQQDISAWNAQVMDAMMEVAETGVPRQGLSGSSTNVRGQEVDEYGAGETQKSEPGAVVAFDLRRLAYPLGQTTRWLRNATVADVAIGTQSVQAAHLRDLRMYMKRAIYTSTNRTFNDLNVDNFTLNIKAFHNADGDPIPDSPQDGSTFNPATHTHYLANATLDTASADSLINTVIEHSVDADIRIVINRADIANWQGLAGFISAQPVLLQYNLNNDVPTTAEARNVTSNKFIGQYKEADVWVKPWGIQNYAFCYDRNAPRPLGYRTEGGLSLVQDLMLNPLTTNFFEALFGFGARTRTNGACLQHNNATYQNPTITG